MADVDELIDSFSKSVLINLYNPSPYQLYVKDGALYTEVYIPPNHVLGELSGTPSYIWEMKHNDYIIVDDELVLNIENTKHNMLHFVQEENCSRNISNSRIWMQLSKDGDKNFYLLSKNEIFPHQEIVYNTYDFICEDMDDHTK